ncbi:MAG: ATP-binding protein [Thermoanaerobaculia bacterium]
MRSSPPSFATLALRTRALRERLGLTRARYFTPDVPSPWVRAALGLGIAFAGYWSYTRWQTELGEDRFFLFAFPAVVAAAWIGRALAGIVATAGCTLLTAFFFVEPLGSFAIEHAEDARGLLLFLAFGVGTSLLLEGLYLAREREAAGARQRQQLAEELLVEQQRQAILLANLPGLVWELRADPLIWPPQVQFASANAWRLTGYPADQWRRSNLLWETLLPESGRAEFENALRVALRKGSWNLRHTLRRDDGSLRCFDTHLTATPSRVGSHHDLRCVSFDVTELELAERALAETERRFRAAADRAPIMIWIAQPERGTVWCNRAWLDFRGRTLEEERGAGWRDGIHADDVDAVSAEIGGAYERREEFRTELRIRRADGAWRWILSIGVPRRDAAGAFQDYLGFCIDVSERKQLELDREELLRQTERFRAEAELATRAKDEFLAKVSHELRNPLNGILGWTQILTGGDSDEHEMRRGVQLIDTSARSLARLVDDLLDVSRILSGKLRLSLVPTRLAAVIDAACQAIQPSAVAKGVTLRTRIADPLPRVDGDSQRLQQVLWNLLSNAVKFTPAGGRVELAARATTTAVEIEVSDDGIGIEPEFLPYVFAPFRQAEGSPSRRHQGLGLGLSIVQHLVEQHGGSIAVASEGAGRGCRFLVSLPLAKLDETLPPEPQAPAREGIQGLRVLVLDDDAAAREIVRTVLARAGAAVREAGSVDEAISMLAASPPDLVLSDLEIPGEDGFSFIRRLRELAEDRGGAVPAIALTAYARDSDRRRAQLAGFQEHHAKPIDAAGLLATIEHLVHR